jgi:hypothetical protein
VSLGLVTKTLAYWRANHISSFEIEAGNKSRDMWNMATFPSRRICTYLYLYLHSFGDTRQIAVVLAIIVGTDIVDNFAAPEILLASRR